MSLKDKVASLFIFHTSGYKLSSFYATYKPGGLILMEDNIPPNLAALKAEAASLTIASGLPLLIAIDEEGDTVKRLASDTYPEALTLLNLPPSATKDAFSKRSELLKSTGININFGIIADVTANPKSFIFPRVLGTTTQSASERVSQAVLGSKGKTLSTVKHFPGHGETIGDSHTSIPTAATTLTDWQTRVARPFKAGIDAGVDTVMFGHLRYTAVDDQPASLSKKWHNIARDQLGFSGVIITDDMIMLQHSDDMQYRNPVVNAVKALQADNDLLLYVTDHGEKSALDPEVLINGVVAAIHNNEIHLDDLNQHVRRVLTIRHQLFVE